MNLPPVVAWPVRILWSLAHAQRWWGSAIHVLQTTTRHLPWYVGISSCHCAGRRQNINIMNKTEEKTCISQLASLTAQTMSSPNQQVAAFLYEYSPHSMIKSNCCYAANIHNIIHSDSILFSLQRSCNSFLKLPFVLKTKPHELVKTGASQRGGEDERWKTRRMKRTNKVMMRRRLRYTNIRRAGVLFNKEMCGVTNSSQLLSYF